MRELDLSYQQALPVLPFQAERLHILVVGLGGTGSFLARHVACLISLLVAAGKKATLTFIDPDKVESVNLPRQHFCPAEIGRYKAETLAMRYAQAFGIEIACIPERFSPEMVHGEWRSLTILVGCVDNAAARVAMGQVLSANEPLAASQGSRVPHLWWLDLGNGLDFGQVLLGSTASVEALASAFAISGLPCCSLLPSPLLQEPGLRKPRPEEQEGHSLSCAQLLAASAQAMTINAAMADEGADYLYRLLITGDLRKFATYLDLPSGTKKSHYTTPETLAKVIGRDPSFFLPSSASPV
jgi:PRTRC genetic system ThiF family protein